MAALERTISSRFSTSSSSSSPSSTPFSLSRASTSTSPSSSSSKVLAIECVRGTSRADEWSGSLLQTGDIVEEIELGGGLILSSPFKDGKSGVQKHLHNCFKKKLSSIKVKVRRGELAEYIELTACIVPQGRRKQYVLRAIDDPNYAISFFDRTEAECMELQASRESRLHHALLSSQLQDGYVRYPWEKRTQEMLQIPNSSCFFSILFFPKASTKESDNGDVEDTLARANAWLNASQLSGVPIIFMNIQTESLLTKISGETASSPLNTSSSLSDLSNLANASIYGFEDYHGVDIGVVRSIRLWYTSIQGEYPIEIDINDSDVKLGFAISRTEEGFIYISSVLGGDEDVPVARSGLGQLYRDAMRDNKLLVISRVNKQKILPWIVSTSGAIRCFDTVSLSQKFSLHRHARVALLIHVLMWDQRSPSSERQNNAVPLASFPDRFSSSESHRFSFSDSVSQSELIGGGADSMRLARDTAGEESFRFHQFSLPDNWV